MAGYVYFFKHIDIKGVKIGCTTKKDVKNRFTSFKTASPYGAEVKAVISTPNPFGLEKIIHDEMSSFRMNGEFFDLSDAQISYLSSKYGGKTDSVAKVNSKIEYLYNSLAEDEKGVFLNYINVHIRRFSLRIDESGKDKTKNFIISEIEKRYAPGQKNLYDTALSNSEIMEMFFKNDPSVTARKLGMVLKENGFEKKSIRVDGKVIQAYLLFDK